MIYLLLFLIAGCTYTPPKQPIPEVIYEEKKPEDETQSEGESSSSEKESTGEAQIAQVTGEIPACRTAIHNRGRPSASFIKEVILWARSASDSVFAPNEKYDIYSLAEGKLGPLTPMSRRRAIMVESIIVLAGYESSWNWNAGRDTTNPNADSCSNEEAGLLQTSYDSNGFDPKLPQLMKKHCGDTSCSTFRKCSKTNHTFALTYTAVLMRSTIRHYGPLIRKSDVYAHLRPACVKELQKMM